MAGNSFCVPMSMDLTMKDQGRMKMEELCVYQVRDGKIARGQFFYDT